MKWLNQILKWLIKWFVDDSNVRAAIVGAFLGALFASTPSLIASTFNQPPSESIIHHLMDQEAQAAQNHNLDLLTGIYTPSAVLADEGGCQTPSQGQVWFGIQAIRDRYSTLSQFPLLAHVNVHVTWVPNDSSATAASATAETTGSELNPSSVGGTSPTYTTLHGHELWTFAKSQESYAKWLITSFMYNVC